MQPDSKEYRLSANDSSFVRILPDFGGTVHQLALADTSGKLHQILRCDEETSIQANQGFRGRLLFPFCGRIRNGQYSWQGTTYQLACNNKGNALHGFVYRHGMKLLDLSKFSDSDSAASRLSLAWDLPADQEQGFPFSLRLQADYHISSGGFRLRLTASNTGRTAAPVSLGWHPYFRLNTPLENYRLDCPSGNYIPMGSDLFPSGPESLVDGTDYDFAGSQRLGERRLDGPIRNSGDGIIELHAAESAYRIRIQADPRLYGYYQLFTPPLRDCLAIEPVSAVSGSFESAELGLRSLQPGESLTGDISISLLDSGN